MSFRWSIYVVFSCSFLGFLAAGCQTPPPPGSEEEEESIETITERMSMMKHRARIEPRAGIAAPINNEFKVASIADGGVSGIKGVFEAVEKGMWLGLSFDYANIESESPVNNPQSAAALTSQKTEALMKSFDRFEFLFVFEYDIPLGSHQPAPEGSEWGFYSPIFRPGVGLGLIALNPKEADGADLIEFDTMYTFLARPNVSLLFPFHQHFGVFVEADFDWVPEVQFTGSGPAANGGKVDTDIGDEVEVSTINLWFGITLEF